MPAEHRIGKQLLHDVYGAITKEVEQYSPDQLDEARKFKDRTLGVDTQGMMDFSRECFLDGLGKSQGLNIVLDRNDITGLWVMAMSMGIELGVAAEKRRQMEKLVDD